MVRTLRYSMAMACMLAPAWAGQPKSCRPTLRDYEALQKGLTYGQVENRFGCGGRRSIAVRSGSRLRTTYEWFGHGTFGANINLTFVNGRLTDKSQLGLR